jgi:hypothetical protein
LVVEFMNLRPVLIQAATIQLDEDLAACSETGIEVIDNIEGHGVPFS